MIYENTEPSIPISVILLKANESPDTRQSPRLFLFNENTGARILNNVLVPEISNGLYTYSWTHGISTNTSIIYYIVEGSSVASSGKFRIVTTKQDIQNLITTSKNELLADILAKKDIIVSDALSNKNDLITEMDTNTGTITTEIENTNIIINENIDDSDGRVS